jgi:hypothetical protein
MLRMGTGLTKGGTLAAIGIGVGIGFACACGASKPPPPGAPTAPAAVDNAPSGPPATQAVETGKDCATAQGQCGGGICNVTVKNACNTAVRCELEVAATCESQSGTAESGGRERDTFAAGTSGDLGARATCADGRVVRTEVRSLTCK